MNIGKALSWDDLATLYDASHSPSARPARTLRMETVFQWAERQTDVFYVDSENDTIHLIEQEKKGRGCTCRPGSSWFDFSGICINCGGNRKDE